ncbi:DUF4489 domain-containing protein [Wukongibacter baidiensis]|uniref:DUF4489 domain-containing protein n=1 Tax=Wukongibacter baidiensis TaxID=1723361 RepID=UPI003D7F5559
MTCSSHRDCKTVDDFAICKVKHPKPKKILLECGEGTGSRTFTSSDESPFQLAHIVLDTTCLKRPEVLVKFSSLVKVQALIDGVITVKLKYELFRACDGKEPLSLETWEYEKIISLKIFDNIEESFNFIFCECQTCSDYCDYFVSVTPVEITNASVTVNNGRMATLTQALCDRSRNEAQKDIIKNKCLESEKILLACGKGIPATQLVIADSTTGTQSPINLAHVTVDTTCLNKPKVLIEFSSIIKTGDQNFTNLLLQFELFKVCGDNQPMSCGIWTFEETIEERIDVSREQRSFSFIFCECSNISECCRYFVEVTPMQTSVAENTITSWEVYNTQINAYAQSSKNDDIECHDYNRLEDKGDCIICEPVHPKPKRILLECGNSSGSRTFIPSSDEMPFQLAHVTIDTTCLCKPVVNIEFSSTLIFEDSPGFESNLAQVQYELFRACDGGDPVSIGFWIVERVGLISDKTSETFEFIYCDCVTCPGCCDYFVTATQTEFTETDVMRNAITTVGNGRIVAVAQEI